MRSMIVAALLCLSGFVHGQALPYVPRAIGAYVSPGGTGAAGTWYALTGTGSSPIPYVPGAQGLYVSTDGTGAAGTWVPWTGATSSPPTGTAGGDLGGSYPNPTVVASHIASGGAAFTSPVTAPAFGGTTICNNGGSPAFCAAAPAGLVVVAVGATTLQIQSTAITTNSSCFFTYKSAGTLPTNIATMVSPVITAQAAGSITVTFPVPAATNAMFMQFFCFN